MGRERFRRSAIPGAVDYLREDGEIIPIPQEDADELYAREEIERGAAPVAMGPMFAYNDGSPTDQATDASFNAMQDLGNVRGVRGQGVSAAADVQAREEAAGEIPLTRTRGLGSVGVDTTGQRVAAQPAAPAPQTEQAAPASEEGVNPLANMGGGGEQATQAPGQPGVSPRVEGALQYGSDAQAAYAAFGGGGGGGPVRVQAMTLKRTLPVAPSTPEQQAVMDDANAQIDEAQARYDEAIARMDITQTGNVHERKAFTEGHLAELNAIAERRNKTIERFDGVIKRNQDTVRKLEDDAANFKIVPDRRDTGTRVRGAIALLFEGLGRGLDGNTGPSAVMQIINDSIDRDIESQKATLSGKQSRIGRTQTLIQQLYAERGNIVEAEQLARVALLETAKIELESLDLTNATEESQAAAVALREKVDLEKAMAHKASVQAALGVASMEETTKLRSGGGGGGGAAKAGREAALEDLKRQRDAEIKGQGEGKGPIEIAGLRRTERATADATTVRDLREKKTAHDNALSSIQSIRGLLKQLSVGDLAAPVRTKVQRRLEAETQNLLTNKAKSYGGVITSSDREAAALITAPDVGTVKGGLNNAKSALDQFDKITRREFRNTATNVGYDVEGALPEGAEED